MRRKIWLMVLLIVAALAGGSTRLDAQEVTTVQAGEYTISGPYSHNNLTVYLIHGKESAPGVRFLTLQEAMEQNKVIVHETGSVNELSIENLSATEEIYIQSGDIVKGGRQDRTLSYDLVLQPKSGKVPLPSFCVEHGRWSKREGESDKHFNSSTTQLASRELKLAAKYDRNQSKVWEKVKKTQDSLSSNAGVTVNAAESESSLQLSLENDRVQEMADEYMSALLKIVDGKDDVIGYAFAINGTANSADVYANGELFGKLWPKLLKAAAVESIVELKKDAPATIATHEEIGRCITDTDDGKVSDQEVGQRVNMVTRDADKAVMFETRDKSRGGKWIHRNYIRK